MNRINIIQITLFVSVLVFNPAVADELRVTTNIQSTFNNTIEEDITLSLFDRGLEKKVAKERARKLIGENEIAFAMMLDTVLHECSDISKDGIIEYLSNAALYGKNVSLHSYDNLIELYTRIKGSIPDDRRREKLMSIARSNTRKLSLI